MKPERLTEIETALNAKLFPSGGYEEVRELIAAVKEYQALLNAEPTLRGEQWLPCSLSVNEWTDIHGKDTWERTTGHFHGGTTWEAMVKMERDNYDELRQAMSEGAYCEFTLYPESMVESRAQSGGKP